MFTSENSIINSTIYFDYFDENYKINLNSTHIKMGFGIFTEDMMPRNDLNYVSWEAFLNIDDKGTNYQKTLKLDVCDSKDYEEFYFLGDNTDDKTL